MDAFTKQYIKTALWSTTDNSDEQGVEPLDACHGPEDIHPDTLAKMLSDCQKFQTDNNEMIASDPEQAGHDFWLTRNGHGAGFWDGDWDEYGTELTTASETYGEFDLYIGDDGMIHGLPLA